jgi:Nickel responsive protein SCO4226-like
MLYAAKCYWPGVDQAALMQVAGRAAQASFEPGTHAVSYRGSLLFLNDDLVLCLFEGPSRVAVMRASERVGIPCERVMDSAWLGPHSGAPAPQTTPHQRRHQ